MKEFNVKSYLRQVLRKAFMHAPIKAMAYRAARVGKAGNADIYKCAACKKQILRSESQLDHITPVTPIKGWDDWNGYISRLFCEIEGLKELQVVCKPCHKEKTLAENYERKKYNTGPFSKKSVDKIKSTTRKQSSKEDAKIVATSVEDGKQIKFVSPGAAARRLKLDRENIKKCIAGTRKRVGKWKFSEI